jgi:hypothetical protein
MSSLGAERQLILLSAGTAARRLALRERARALLGDVDWQRLAETLRRRRLLGTLGPRILELSEDTASGDFAAAVEQTLQNGRRQGAFLQLVCERLVNMLADAGIRSAALKGPLLAEAIYGDCGRRLSTDVDLLVAPDQLRRAVQVVRELGYSAPEDHLQASGVPLLHYTLAHERAELPPVELHWRIHWYEGSFAHERLLPASPAAPSQWRPAPEDELLGLLLFYARDGFIDLRLATDLSAWWDMHGEELPPHGLAPRLDEYPALARAVRAAAATAERVVGLPASRALGARAALGLRARAAVRLANPNPRSGAAQLYADMGLVDGLLAPPGGLRAFVRRQLLPPAEVRDAQARHGGRRRARSRLGRCVGVLGRYTLAVPRLLRGPELPIAGSARQRG